MKKWLQVLSFVWLLQAPVVMAEALPSADAPASEASVRELLAVTQAQKSVDSALSKVDGSMQAFFRKRMEGRKLTDEQQKLLDDMRTKILQIVREELNWADMEPVYIEMYRKNFTQGEVDGMLAFYRTSAGQALITKLPGVLQQTLQVTQNKMQTMLPRLMAVQKETAEKLEATEKK